MSGIGRVLVIVYGIMALAATGRSFVQIVEKFDQAPVEQLVGLGILFLVFGTECRGEAVMDCRQRGQRRRIAPLAKQARGMALDQGHDLEFLVHRFGGERRDHGAASRLQDDEIFGRQNLKRLAQRRTGDAEQFA